MQSRVQDLQEAHAGAFLGHLELDLRQSTLYEGYGELAVTAICGHVQLLVPPDWEVQVQPSIGFRARTGDSKPNTDAQSSSSGSQFLKVHVLGLLGSTEIQLA
jgi:predicted membrane protein